MSSDDAANASAAEDCPLVTLTVKAYRQEYIVRHAIESAFAQTYQPLEIILSDDCSPDGTFAVMEEMAAAYDGPHRVILNRNPTNLGIAGHNRHTWNIAYGQLVTVCAGDDIAEPHRVERLVEAWRAGEGRVMAVHSQVLKIDAENSPLEEWAPDQQIIDDASPLNIIRTGANCIGATAMWDRRLFEHFGQLSEQCLIEDGPWFFRAALLGEIAYVDEPLVRYRVGGVSDFKQVSPGEDYLYGLRMMKMSWRVANALSFLHDLEQVEFPGKAACQALAREIVDKHAYEIGLWRAGPLGSAARLPSAFLSGDIRRLKLTLKHALGPLYVLYYNYRYPARMA